MTRELVFHLGDRKTGSTSIQATLREQNWTGGGATVAYPARLHSADIAKPLSSTQPVSESRRAFKLLEKRLDATDADISVVSSEHFEIVRPTALRDALAAHLPKFAENARFITYLRPHSDRLLSSYAERLKLGLSSETLDSFVANAIRHRRFQYFDRVKEWRSVFGDRFEVRPMIRQNLFQNCVVRDFLSFTLRSESFQLRAEPSSNESLTVKDLAILIELHKELGGETTQKKSQQAIGRNLGLVLAGFPLAGSAKPALDKKLSAIVIRAHQKDAASLDSTFFKGTPMTDALVGSAAKALDSLQSIRAEDHFSPEELRMLHVWTRLVGQMYRLDPEGWVKHFTTMRLGLSAASHLDDQDDSSEVPVVTGVPLKGGNLKEPGEHLPSNEEKRRTARLQAELKASDRG